MANRTQGAQMSRRDRLLNAVFYGVFLATASTTIIAVTAVGLFWFLLSRGYKIDTTILGVRIAILPRL